MDSFVSGGLGSLSVGACVLALGCSSAPHAPPAPIESDETARALPTSSSVEPMSPLVAVLEPRSNLSSVTGPLRAEVIPGMERLERISVLEGGIACGTRIGKSAVCVGDDRSAQASIEGLQPVKRLDARHGTHCSLLETGKLACSLVSESTGRLGSVTSTSVTDFVIGLHGDVFALSAGGNVVANAARDDGTIRTKIVLRGVDAIASAYAGVCARTLKGQVECTDHDAPLERGTHVVNAVNDVVAIDSDGVIRKKDKSLWVIGADGRDPFVATRIERPEGIGAVAALDFGSEPDRCALTTDGGISCFDGSRSKSIADFASQPVELPRPAVKLRPVGGPCAELDNGTVACWGEAIGTLKRLGLRTLQLSPGSVAPRP